MLPGLSSFAPYRCASDKPELCLLFHLYLLFGQSWCPISGLNTLNQTAKVMYFFEIAKKRFQRHARVDKLTEWAVLRCQNAT